MVLARAVNENIDIQIDDQLLKQVKDFKFFGRLIDGNGKADKEIQQRQEIKPV